MIYWYRDTYLQDSPQDDPEDDRRLMCPSCRREGSLADDFDIGGLPDDIVICNWCHTIISVETGERYYGPLDEGEPIDAEFEVVADSIVQRCDSILL